MHDCVGIGDVELCYIGEDVVVGGYCTEAAHLTAQLSVCSCYEYVHCIFIS